VPVEIRSAVPADAPGVLAIYAPVVRDSPTSFEFEPPTVEEMRERMEVAARVAPWLVCVEGDALLGYAYAVRFRARPAYAWALESSVGHHRLIAGITLPNAASVRLHEGLGFVAWGVVHEVGYKFARWHDVGFWELVLGEGRAPAAPFAPEALLEREEWVRAPEGAARRVNDAPHLFLGGRARMTSLGFFCGRDPRLLSSYVPCARQAWTRRMP